MNNNGKKETIVVFGAHSDDFVIGAGGTLAKYASEGHKVISVVFSFGENSHPWLKAGIVQQMRSQEAFDASKVMKLSRIIFYDLTELKFYEEYLSKNISSELIQLIDKEKVTKIFTHCPDDPHPDHKEAYKICLDLWEKSRVKPELYTYSVWNPVSFQTKHPALYVNVTKYFKVKLAALRSFHSQRFQAVYPLMFFILFRAIKEGLKIKTFFGEKFFRVK